MADFTIVRSLKRSADAAEHQAAQYRKAGRDDDADASAKDGRRWRYLANRAPELFAEQDRAAQPVEHVDYAEAEAVREIKEEMALEAAGVERWEDL